jgi:subtilisin family serine protease
MVLFVFGWYFLGLRLGEIGQLHQNQAALQPHQTAIHLATSAHPSSQALALREAQKAPKLTSKVVSLASAQTIPSSSPSTLSRYDLPDYPHTQYKYEAMAGVSPSGPLYSMEPFLNRISASPGWADATAANSNPAPTIAVIDTGFALGHQDLVGRWTNNGWDFVHNTDNPMAGQDDPNGSAVFHGTMTAGLAGLLDPNAKIMPLQAMNDEGVGYTDEIAAAVRYAADNGANIISMSLGTSVDDSYLHAQIDYAISKGVLVVAAAGNNGCNCLSYPADYPEVLSAGASNSNDTPASFSSYGANLDVLAPGTAGDVCSAFYTSTNATTAYSCGYSGTSFATPITAGLASLLLQQYPGETPAGLIATIEQSADKPPGMDGQDFTQTYGYGRIDVAAAVSDVSLQDPGGELLNKHSVSLSSTDPTTSPQMASTCSGVPDGSCDMVLNGPSGQMIDLGTQALDPIYGGTVYYWDAAQLGLTPGQWTITVTETGPYNQSSTLPPQALTISP